MSVIYLSGSEEIEILADGHVQTKQLDRSTSMNLALKVGLVYVCM